MLVRVGRQAVDVDLLARIEDEGEGEAVRLIFKDKDRVELRGDDADAARCLVASLPAYIPQLGVTPACGEDMAGERLNLADDDDARPGVRGS